MKYTPSRFYLPLVTLLVLDGVIIGFSVLLGQPGFPTDLLGLSFVDVPEAPRLELSPCVLIFFFGLI